MGCLCFCKDNDEEKKPDPAFTPTEKRGCRDLFWLALFLAFQVGMIVVMGIAFSKGDYKRITNGLDFRGCLCGSTNAWDAETNECILNPPEGYNGTTLDMATKSVFVVFMDTERFGDTPVTVCGKECPTRDGTIVCADPNDKIHNGVWFPEGNSTAEQMATITADHKLGAAQYVQDFCGFTVQSRSYFGYCVPTSTNTTFKQFEEAASAMTGGQSWGTAFASVQKAGMVIFMCLLFSIAFSFVYLKLVEKFAACVTYTALLGFLFAMLIASFMLYNHSNKVKAAYGDSQEFKNDRQYQTSFYGSIVMFVLAALYLLAMCALFKSIQIAVQCAKLAAECVGDNPTTILMPFFTVLVFIGIFGWWCATTVFLFSAGELQAVDPPSPAVPKGVFKTFKLDNQLQGAFVYHLFGLYWIEQFALALVELTIAYITAYWYFTDMQNGERQTSGVRGALKVVARYHLGSIAVGSFIIAVIQMIRTVIEYLDRKRKKLPAENKAVTAMCCCVKCCMWCVQKCMRFINRQAYVQIAIRGVSFCTGCQEALGLMIRNLGTVASLRVVATLYITMGKLMIMGASTLLCFMVLTNVPAFSDVSRSTAVPSPFMPCVLTAIFTYGIGGMFMNIFNATIDTILMCFVWDKEKNGSPIHASEGMAETVSGLEEKAKKVRPVNEDAMKGEDNKQNSRDLTEV